MIKSDTRPILSEKDIDLFLSFVKRGRGVDISSYRKSFLSRRLTVRFNARGVRNLAEYIGLLKKDPDEWNCFLDALSINVSEFFRDADVFTHFRDYCLPELIRRKKGEGEKNIRLWSCGCSCGEEAYSLAIVLKEFLESRCLEFTAKIFATDIDSDALHKAKAGIYSITALESVDKKILEDYFTPLSSEVYAVKDELKKWIIFRRQNIFTDEFFKNIDVIFFRNVRIYFDRGRADTILAKIQYSLRKGGYLVIGKAEDLSFAGKTIFEPVDTRYKIYRKI